ITAAARRRRPTPSPGQPPERATEVLVVRTDDETLPAAVPGHREPFGLQPVERGEETRLCEELDFYLPIGLTGKTPYLPHGAPEGPAVIARVVGGSHIEAPIAPHLDGRNGARVAPHQRVLERRPADRPKG